MSIDYDRTYGRKERGEIFSHIPLRTQRSWIDSGLAESSGEDYDGRGLKREFKFEHLLQLTLVEQLNGLNLPHKVIRHIMQDNFFGHVKIDRSTYFFEPPPGDMIPKIMNNLGHFLVIFHGAGYDVIKGWAKEDIWKAALVPAKQLSDFFTRFSNPAEDDVRIHAIKLGLDGNPIATILIDLSEVQARLLDYFKKAGISAMKPI